MKLRVMQKHIDAGEPGEACRCAMAMAFIGAGFDDVQVFGEETEAWKDGVKRTFKASDDARLFITQFDLAPRAAQPATFEFEEVTP